MTDLVRSNSIAVRNSARLVVLVSRSTSVSFRSFFNNVVYSALHSHRDRDRFDDTSRYDEKYTVNLNAARMRGDRAILQGFCSNKESFTSRN